MLIATAEALSEYRLKIGDFAPPGQLDTKSQVEGVTPTNHSSQKNLDRLFFSFVTIHFKQAPLTLFVFVNLCLILNTDCTMVKTC